jgi:hypothetical protein
MLPTSRDRQTPIHRQRQRSSAARVGDFAVKHFAPSYYANVLHRNSLDLDEFVISVRKPYRCLIDQLRAALAVA